MGSALALKAGLETGRTMYGHNDFKITEDAVSDCYYGNLTYYSKSVVTQPNNVTLLRHVFSCGYVGGNDLEPLTLEGDRDSATPASLQGSMLTLMIPEYDPAFDDDGVNTAPIDITGCYAPGSPLSHNDEGREEGGLHWCGGALVYLALAGHRTLGRRNFYNSFNLSGGMDELYWSTTSPRNTLLQTGSYIKPDPEGTQGGPRTIRGNGHWAGLTAQGDAARRAGEPGYA
mgnify:CR=1 FL=1